MKTKSRLLLLALFLLALGGAAAANGAGGLLVGLVQPSWNPSFMPGVPSSLPDIEYMGGYGYGISREGTIVGGFGLAFLDYGIYDSANWEASSQASAHVAGGAGGLVVGSRVFGSRWSHLDIAARLGLGGMGLATKDALSGSAGFVSKGYAIVYAEPYIELGVGLTRWMQLGASLSYLYIGNFVPGKPLNELVYFTPAVGISLTFGRF
jgi:hypothetical protein